VKRRGILGLLLVCAMLLCAPLSAVAEVTNATDVMDLNNVNMIDTFAVYNSVSNGAPMSVVYNRIAADVNHDTRIDMTDAFALYRVASGATDDLPTAVEVEVTEKTISETTAKQTSVEKAYASSDELWITHSWNLAEVKLVCYDDDTVYVKLLLDSTRKIAQTKRLTVTMDPAVLEGREAQLVLYASSSVPKSAVPFEEIETLDGLGPADGKQVHTATLIRSPEEWDALKAIGFEATLDEAFFEESALLWVYAEENNVARELDVTGLQVRENVLIAETTARYYTDVMRPSRYHKHILLRVPAKDVQTLEAVDTIRYMVRDIPYCIYPTN